MNSAPFSIDAQLLAMLRCPQTGHPLIQATNDQITQVNASIAAKACRDASGELVSEPIQSGLVSQCGTWLYPIRDAIPTMIAEESIKL